MKLTIITGFWPTKENMISGIFVSQQAAAFAQLGCKVRVGRVMNALRSGSRMLPPETPDIWSIDGVDNIPVIGIPDGLSAFPGAARLNVRSTGWAIRRYIKQMKVSGFHPDAAIVHGIRYIAPSAPYWRPLIGGKVAQVVHGVDSKYDDERARAQFRSLNAPSLPYFDSIVAVGTSLLNHTADLGMQWVEVVPNGADVPPAHSIDFSQRCLSAQRVLLSVSNLDRIKGIDLNLQALACIARRCPELAWEYRIVGDGAERARLESLKVELGIADRVHFFGRLGYAETMNEMSACDVFCLPSWREAFGIVYLEAMARGRPVIGCWRNGAQDIVTHGVDGLLVEPRDAESLTTALIQLLSDPEECSRIGRSARATAERFAWEVNARRMLEILSSDATRRLRKPVCGMGSAA